ncbi:YnfA family protein [Actinomycetes bacterium NPDC127524]
MAKSIILFVLAGIAEIGGGYLMWIWIKEGASFWLGIIGAIILAVYGIIPAFQSFPSFGRVYAAYGGVFIILSLLWSWALEKKTPDLYDTAGAILCLAGAAIILWGPRNI